MCLHASEPLGGCPPACLPACLRGTWALTQPALTRHPHPALPPAPPTPTPQGACTGIKAAARTYKDLRDNLGEGLRFYMGLQVGGGARSPSGAGWLGLGCLPTEPPAAAGPVAAPRRGPTPCTTALMAP